jgi:hypothetical protein
LTVLDVLAKQVGIRGMFSDWPATTTFYASCMGVKRADIVGRIRRSRNPPLLVEQRRRITLR